MAAIRQTPKFTACDAAVLLNGETGAGGKEMFARAIHYLSPRATDSFMAWQQFQSNVPDLFV